MAEITKYVHLKSIGIPKTESVTAEIEITSDGKLALYMYDEAGAIFKETEPVILNLIDNERGVKRLKFLSFELIAQFSEEGFELHKELLEKIQPGITWETAEIPTREEMPKMNPTDPPRT